MSGSRRRAVRQPRSLLDHARSVCNAPTFVDGVERLAEQYSFWLQRDERPGVKKSRRALREFEKLAEHQLEWMRRSLDQATAEHDIARLLRVAAMEHRMLLDVERGYGWLLEAQIAAKSAWRFLKDDKRPRATPPFVALMLRDLFGQHDIPVKLYEKSAAVTLLVAIAAEAGDSSLTPGAAKKFLGIAMRRYGSATKKARKRS